MIEMVRMNVGRCTGIVGFYVFSVSCELTNNRSTGEITVGNFSEDFATVLHPNEFHKIFDKKFRLRKGQGPVIIKFPKIKVKVVK